MKTVSAQVAPFGINGRDELPLIRACKRTTSPEVNSDEQELIPTVTVERQMLNVIRTGP
jgi:hypothetical protein